MVRIPSGIASVLATPTCSLKTLRIATSSNITMPCSCTFDSTNRLVNITVNASWTLDANDFVHWVSISTMKNWAFAGSFSGFNITLDDGSGTFGSFAITYIEDAFTSKSITNSDPKAAFPNIHTITVVTKTAVPAGGVIVVVAPA